MASCAELAGCPPLQVQGRDIVEYLGREGLSTNTIATYFQALSSFYDWALKIGLLTASPVALSGIATPRRKRMAPRPVPSDRLGDLFAGARSRKAELYLLLGILQGLRVSEIAAVHGHMVNLSLPAISVLGKGGHLATLPLHPMIHAIAVTMPRDDFWFPSPTTSGGHVTGRHVSDTIRDVMRRAGVPGTPHALRHWYGTELMRQVGNARIVQELLRHMNLSSTMIYTQVTSKEMATGIATLDLWKYIHHQHPELTLRLQKHSRNSGGTVSGGF